MKRYTVVTERVSVFRRGQRRPEHFEETFSDRAQAEDRARRVREMRPDATVVVQEREA